MSQDPVLGAAFHREAVLSHRAVLLPGEISDNGTEVSTVPPAGEILGSEPLFRHACASDG